MSFREQAAARIKIWLTHAALAVVGGAGFFFFRGPFNFTRVLGRKNVPRQGHNVLFVSNHVSMYDSVLIAVCAYFPAVIFHPSRPPFNFAAEENFFFTWYARVLFKLLRTVPVKRGRRDPFLMRKYINFLEKNNILIFYQGGRSYDLGKIKSGPAFVIAEAETPPIVIPIYHRGMERIFPRGGPGTNGPARWIPMRLFRRPVIYYGKPVDFSDLRALEDKREKIALVNRRIVETIEALAASVTERLGPRG
ncbi:MAG TPA: lysophospholipid acyltransferase family protein [bacterium]|nr:lysophospholipid acyltransferase family protein [bacterium]HPJ72708.1 lysophospholipid acyltransferase family protein [bacterium]HPQ66695.1 lysophospholipid acyltransferase family protein [bacterium]